MIGPIATPEKGGGKPSEEKTAGGKATAPETPAKDGAFAGAIPVRLRLLSASDAAEMALMVAGDGAPDKALAIKAHVRVKLIEVALDKLGLGASALQSGRLPEAGRDEIIAGARIEQREQLLLGGGPLKVVGTLKPDIALFADSYLIPPSDSASKFLPHDVPTVWPARLVKVPAEQLRDSKTQKEIEAAFPADKYATFTPTGRLDSRAFYRYLGGLALFLLGGTGALIGLFRWLAGRPGMSGKDGARFFAAPLLEMRQRPRLLWAVHLIYFGTVMAASALIYEQPEVQTVLLSKVGEAFGAKDSPFGIVGEVYRSGNIALAALLTFVVNFFAGSLGYITLTSILFFGAGLFLTWFRAFMWGFLLAPTIPDLAYSMLPHSGTMLLEGEGYILAAFFGFLIPIHTLSSRLGGNLLSRWAALSCSISRPTSGLRWFSQLQRSTKPPR